MKVSVSELQKRPSLLKSEEILEVVDKRSDEEVGIFVPKKYRELFERVKIELEKSRKKQVLQKIKEAEDMSDWEEVVGDGL